MCTNNKKLVKHNPLSDMASLIVIIAAVLYLYGGAYFSGRAIGLGISSSLINYDAYGFISAGFINLYLVLLINPLGHLVSGIILITTIALYENKKIKNSTLYFGILLFVFAQFIVTFTAGKMVSEKVNEEIESHLKDSNVELAYTKKAVINFTSSGNEPEILTGLLLIGSDEYEILANADGVHAVKKSRIVKIQFIK